MLESKIKMRKTGYRITDVTVLRGLLCIFKWKILFIHSHEGKHQNLKLQQTRENQIQAQTHTKKKKKQNSAKLKPAKKQAQQKLQ
jgi:hypothetical protein